MIILHFEPAHLLQTHAVLRNLQCTSSLLNHTNSLSLHRRRFVCLRFGTFPGKVNPPYLNRNASLRVSSLGQMADLSASCSPNCLHHMIYCSGVKQGHAYSLCFKTGFKVIFIIHPILIVFYPTCICSYLDIVYVLVSKELKKVASVPLTHGKPMKVMQSTLKICHKIFAKVH